MDSEKILQLIGGKCLTVVRHLGAEDPVGQEVRRAQAGEHTGANIHATDAILNQFLIVGRAPTKMTGIRNACRRQLHRACRVDLRQ